MHSYRVQCTVYDCTSLKLSQQSSDQLYSNWLAATLASVLVSCVVKVRGVLLQTVMKMFKVLKEALIGLTIFFPDRSLVLSVLQLYVPLWPWPLRLCECVVPGTWVIRNQFLSMSTLVSSSSSLSAMSCNHLKASLLCQFDSQGLR